MGKGSFRRRLTLSFVLVAAVSTAVLATTSFLLVKRDRTASFTKRSLDKARLASTIADSRLSVPPSADEITDLIATLRRRAGMGVVVKADGRVFSSAPGLDVEQVTETLDAVVGDELRSSHIELSGEEYLLVTPAEPAQPELYFLFSRANLIAQMNQLSGLLWRVWFALMVAAALVGHLVARRTLRPIARAGEAAAALAEGMLDTRLPADSTDEFGAWAASFNRMAAALQDKIEALEEAAARERRFTSDVAHELRTPLSGLVTSTEMLLSANAEMGPQAGWAAERLAEQVKRLRRLVEELLEISRLDSGRESLRITRLDLRDLIRRLLAHHGWASRVQVDAEEGSVATDPRRVDRILGNLISNAIEHGAGTVTVHARIEDSEVVFQVKDEGPGIPSADRRRIFDRFYKSDPSRAGGSGLGLSIARQNARLLGGELTLSVNDGTTFIARLPRELDVTDAQEVVRA